jgi:hypothetical protein
VTRALELITEHLHNKPLHQAFAVIVNSGIPDAWQNQTALAICAVFAQRAGLNWVGSLALGGGQSIVNGTPLNELGWRGNSIRAALEVTAACLAAQKPIPDEAVRMMAKKRMPQWWILLAGSVSWTLKARKYGMEKLLHRQPYLSEV